MFKYSNVCYWDVPVLGNNNLPLDLTLYTGRQRVELLCVLHAPPCNVNPRCPTGAG